jgi:phosphate transport system substrate-binding protein
MPVKLSTLAMAAAVALAGALPSTLARAADITGAGATFPAPVYTAWAADYKAKTGNGLNYQAIGSGGGQTQITNRTVDFGASDAPMAADKLQSANLLQFPTVIGAVVPIVNLPGVESGKLKLTGEILGDIYQGKITAWNDPKIAELNKDVKLPDTAIAPVYRSDGSGTTFVFTSYLAAANAGWKDNVGAATSVQWPAGAGAKGNDGVAGTVKNTEGAIGYVEYVYAASNNLTTVALKNKAGEFVEPTVQSFEAAADKADWKGAKNFAASMIDMDAKGAWPIVSATFILLPKDPKNPAQAKEVMNFFDWAYKDGDATAQKLHYIPLPDAVAEEVRKAWKADVKI